MVMTEHEHKQWIQTRLEYMRNQILAMKLTVGELDELQQDLAEHVPPGDPVLEKWVRKTEKWRRE